MCLSCDVHIHVAIHIHIFLFVYIYTYIYIYIFVIYLQIHIYIYTHLFLIFRERWLFACMVDIIRYSPEMFVFVDTFCGVPVVAIVVAWAATHHV